MYRPTFASLAKTVWQMMLKLRWQMKPYMKGVGRIADWRTVRYGTGRIMIQKFFSGLRKRNCFRHLTRVIKPAEGRPGWCCELRHLTDQTLAISESSLGRRTYHQWARTRSKNVAKWQSALTLLPTIACCSAASFCLWITYRPSAVLFCRTRSLILQTAEQPPVKSISDAGSYRCGIKNNSEMSPIPPINFTRVCRFSTAVTFESFWFGNGETTWNLNEL